MWVLVIINLNGGVVTQPMHTEKACMAALASTTSDSHVYRFVCINPETGEVRHPQ